MPDLMRLLRSIEAAGFDGAGILDSQMLSRDTFVVLGQAAVATSRLTLFPAVTNPFTRQDRKSTRLNSSHGYISYAVFCLKKKKNKINEIRSVATYTTLAD